MLVAWAATALGVLTKGRGRRGHSGGACCSCTASIAGFVALAEAESVAGAGRCFWRSACPGTGSRRAACQISCEFFFMHEHVARYLTPSRGPGGALVVLRPVLLRVACRGRCRPAGAVPWLAPRDPASSMPALFLRIWVLFVCVFFSISDSKLIPYILPAYSGARDADAAGLPDETLERELLRHGLDHLGRWLALGLACVFGPSHWLLRSAPVFSALARPLAEVAALLAASGLYVLAQRRRGDTRRRVFGRGLVLGRLLLVQAAAALSRRSTSGSSLRGGARDTARCAGLQRGTYDQTLPFYWRRTVRSLPTAASSISDCGTIRPRRCRISIDSSSSGSARPRPMP